MIALWLGLREHDYDAPATSKANLEMKSKALARIQEPDTKLALLSPPDDLMKFLQAL